MKIKLHVISYYNNETYIFAPSKEIQIIPNIWQSNTYTVHKAEVQILPPDLKTSLKCPYRHYLRVLWLLGLTLLFCNCYILFVLCIISKFTLITCLLVSLAFLGCLSREEGVILQLPKRREPCSLNYTTFPQQQFVLPSPTTNFPRNRSTR